MEEKKNFFGKVFLRQLNLEEFKSKNIFSEIIMLISEHDF